MQITFKIKDTELSEQLLKIFNVLKSSKTFSSDKCLGIKYLKNNK